MKRDDLTDKTFGRLKVTSFAFKNSRGELYWYCLCKCGTEKDIRANDLRSGKSVSCGCYFHEVHTTHGMTKTRTFKSWESMKGRCTNPNDASYDRYGGAGIDICQSWLDRFENFLSDMGERPEGMTLDRLDNNKGYFPENCRWANPTEQQRNRPISRTITVNGQTKPIIEWAKETGIDYGLLLLRATKGWTEDRILSPPRSKAANGTKRKRPL